MDVGGGDAGRTAVRPYGVTGIASGWVVVGLVVVVWMVWHSCGRGGADAGRTAVRPYEVTGIA